MLLLPALQLVLYTLPAYTIPVAGPLPIPVPESVDRIYPFCDLKICAVFCEYTRPKNSNVPYQLVCDEKAQLHMTSCRTGCHQTHPAAPPPPAVLHVYHQYSDPVSRAIQKGIHSETGMKCAGMLARAKDKLARCKNVLG